MAINGEAMNVQSCSSFDNSHAVDISKEKDGGVMKTIIKPGMSDAHPKTGDNVYVHYVGTLTDGTKFDSSRDRGELFNFTLGRGNVISAWDTVVATMTQAEICKVYCGSKYAYGAAGSPPKIPPNADLIFEIELFKWEGEDISPEHDRTIFRSIQKEGDKKTFPNEGALVDVHVVGFHEERKFLDQDFKFNMGECTEQGLPEAVDKALKRFSKGEKSRISVAPVAGYGKKGHEGYGIPADAKLELEIELRDVEKAKESWEMDADEKIVESEKLKIRGTELFQKGKNNLAAKKYKRIVDMLQHETMALDGDKRAKRDVLYRAAHLNLALVFLKNGENVEAIKHCENVLEEDRSNVKALYRRAEAYQNQNDFDLAIADYEHVLSLEPENKAAKNQIVLCKKKLVDINQQQKKLFANMFERMARTDAKECQANGDKREEIADSKSKQNNEDTPIENGAEHVAAAN